MSKLSMLGENESCSLYLQFLFIDICLVLPVAIFSKLLLACQFHVYELTLYLQSGLDGSFPSLMCETTHSQSSV